MKKIQIVSLVALAAIISYAFWQTLSADKEIGKLFDNPSTRQSFAMSPHAGGIKPGQVDYGIPASILASDIEAGSTDALDNPWDPKVLGQTVSFTLNQPTVSCVSGKTQAKLTWQAYGPATGYYAQKRLRGNKWATISEKLSSTTLTFTDTNTPASGTVLYRIRATADGSLAYSNLTSTYILPCTTTVTPPPPPTVTPPPPVITPPPPATVTPPPPTITPPPPTVTPPPPVITPPPPATVTPPPPTITPPPPTTTTTQKISWGAFNGWRPEDGPAFESIVGQKLKNRAVFVHWGNENQFPIDLAPTLTASGTTLVIFWEAMNYNDHYTNQPNFSYSAILRGDWDAYIKSFATQAQNYGGPVILIPFSEMNGNWNPWSGVTNGNTPAQHISAYRKIRGMFAGVSNVKFGWAVNSNSVPDITGNQITDYYPGDAYVDIVGVDGFNFANPTWMTFSQIFDKPLSILKTYKKPIYIFSMASAQGTEKANWITDALTVQIPKHTEIVGWTWFNENKEKDWRVWSDQASLDAFKSAINRLQ